MQQRTPSTVQMVVNWRMMCKLMFGKMCFVSVCPQAKGVGYVFLLVIPAFVYFILVVPKEQTVVELA